MANRKFIITNRYAYNIASMQRGSLTVSEWADSSSPEVRGRSASLHRYGYYHCSDDETRVQSIAPGTTRLCWFDFQADGVAVVLSGLLSGQREVKDQHQHKDTKRGEITHLVIVSNSLKAFGKGEWNIYQHGADRRKLCRRWLARLTGKSGVTTPWQISIWTAAKTSGRRERTINDAHDVLHQNLVGRTLGLRDYDT